MIFTRLQAYLSFALALVLAIAFGTQTARLHSEQRGHDKLRVDVAEATTQRTTAVLKQNQIDTQKLGTHAAATQGASDVFTASQPVRDASARADADRARRLLSTAEARAATYRAQALANGAACVGLADRLEAFDRHIAEGTGVVGELRKDLERRDAEVTLLFHMIQIDRAFMDPKD